MDIERARARILKKHGIPEIHREAAPRRFRLPWKDLAVLLVFALGIAAGFGLDLYLGMLR